MLLRGLESSAAILLVAALLALPNGIVGGTGGPAPSPPKVKSNSCGAIGTTSTGHIACGSASDCGMVSCGVGTEDGMSVCQGNEYEFCGCGTVFGHDEPSCCHLVICLDANSNPTSQAPHGGCPSCRLDGTCTAGGGQAACTR